MNNDRLEALMQELYQETREKNAAFLAASRAGKRDAMDEISLELETLNTMLKRMERFKKANP